MILAQGKENGLSWSLDAKGMNIYIRVIQDSTKKEFIKKYECQFEPTWGYDVSDVNAVNEILDDMIEEIKNQNSLDYLCKTDKDVWIGKSLVKAKSAIHAWEKLRKAWEKDLENGKADVPMSVITKYSVEKICSDKEVLL